MADLPKYQPTGLNIAQLGNIPRVEFAASAEAIRQSQGIDASLDRISQFAFKEAGEEAKKKGLQFAAENPVTAQQVEAAINEGKKPSDIFAKDGTIFGDAARQLQAQQLRIDLETRTRNSMSLLAAEVDSGTVTDIGEIRSRINGPVEGFAKVLANIDPEESVRFRASMATAGNTIFKSAFDRVIKMDSAARQTALSGAVASSLDIVSRIYEIEPDIEAQKSKIMVERSNLFRALKSSNDPAFITTSMHKFEEQTYKLRVDAISKFVTSTEFSIDPQAAISRLDKNDAGKMTSLWGSLNFEDQAKVRSNLRTIVGQRWDVDDKAKKEVEHKDTIDASKFMADFFATGSRTSLNALQAISIRSPKVVSAETVFKLPKERLEVLSYEVSNPRAELILKTEMLAGKHPTPEAMISRSAELGIGLKTVSSTMLPFFIVRNNEDVRDVEKLFRNDAKIVPGQTNIAYKSAEKYASMAKKQDKLWLDALSKNKEDPANNPLPSRISIAANIIKDRSSSTKTTQINFLLTTLNKNYGESGQLKKTGIVFSESDKPASEIISDIRTRSKQLGLTDPDLNAIDQTIRSIERLQQQRDAE